jgi:hypothetical protein
LEFSIIGLTETWLNDSNVDLYSLLDYQHVYNYRHNRSGGGVSLFIKTDFKYIRRTDLEVFTDNVETLFVELLKDDFTNYSNNILIGLIYRPPDKDMNIFIDYIFSTLTAIKKEHKTIYLMGDFNINLMNIDKHILSSEFLETMFSFSMYPLINKPTRVTMSTATLIDNIYCDNVLDHNFMNGILITDITDHFPVFTINITAQTKEDPILCITRSYNSDQIKNFKNKLQLLDWNSVLQCDNCQTAYSTFSVIFNECYESCFPQRVIHLNYKNRKPWLTNALKCSIKIKNKLYIRSRKYPTNENVNSYKDYRALLNKLLRKKERDHYDNILKQNQNNLRKSWQIIKQIINKTQKTKSFSDKFIINNIEVTDKHRIANSFNQYFVNIGNNLAKKIPPSDIKPTALMKHNVLDTIYLKETDPVEVKLVIMGLKNSSPGWDNVSAGVLRQTCDITCIIDILVYLINMSMVQGLFPSELKVAKVLPLYKNDNKTLLQNYRPVSVLPVFSKIFERIMYKRLLSFINKHKLLYKYQFGFRQGHSTNMAIVCMLDKVLSAIDRGEYAIGIFLDFSKAFDTVNHKILMSKMYKYGIRGHCYSWIESYLYQRQQYVVFDNNCSKKQFITCGVPQGSILGPLLFLLYINDMANISSIIFPILFADDTNLFITGKNLLEMIKILNKELEKVVTWLNVNQLSLNIKKTHYMIFTVGKKVGNISDEIILNNNCLDRVEQTKFLGAIIDSRLSWINQIQCIKRKISKGTGILCKAKKTLSLSALVTLYYCFIYPYINYCIEVWGGSCKTYLLSLEKLQKKVIRLLSSSPPKTHTAPIFDKLKILPINKVYQYSVIMFMYKFSNSLLPDIFLSMFTTNKTVHRYDTRQAKKLHVPKANLTIVSRTIKFKGVNLWNRITEHIPDNCSIQSFKHRVKEFLLSNDFE